MKYKILILFAFFTFSVSAENVSKIIYDSYVNQDMTTWKSVIDSLQNEKDLGKLSIQQKWELLNYQYGYLGWTVSEKKKMKEVAEEYLDVARGNLSELEEKEGSKSSTNAYHSAFIAYDISLNTIKAPFLGLKCMKYGETALKQDSLNYFALIQYGNIMNYMPKVFGGSKDKALENYLKARSIMKKQESLYKDNWLYMNLLLTIADIYKTKKDYESTKQYYLEALELEPEYEFVKNYMNFLCGLEK